MGTGREFLGLSLLLKATTQKSPGSAHPLGIQGTFYPDPPATVENTFYCSYRNYAVSVLLFTFRVN